MIEKCTIIFFSSLTWTKITKTKNVALNQYLRATGIPYNGIYYIKTIANTQKKKERKENTNYLIFVVFWGEQWNLLFSNLSINGRDFGFSSNFFFLHFVVKIVWYSMIISLFSINYKWNQIVNVPVIKKMFNMMKFQFVVVIVGYSFICLFFWLYLFERIKKERTKRNFYQFDWLL